MCNRYTSPSDGDIERQWHLGRSQPWRAAGVYPRAPGPFIRAARSVSATSASVVSSELVIGQWALIPWFAKTPKFGFATNNARAEELAAKPSFKHPWARGQRCIIPATSFDEPCWETGKNVWWSFRRADGMAWGLAGLWATWTDPASGEIHESYTMLTLNADSHPLMSRMHKPDPALPPDRQDKRSVVPIDDADAAIWLHGSVEDAQALLRLTPADRFVAEGVA
jgi:putative SOS response-associated peptidase YedK